MQLPETFRCLLVERDAQGQIRRQLTEQPGTRLPDGEVVIRVEWSSLNYKDALAATGHPGVARQLPHVPGIDAAGTVVASQSPEVAAGDPVIVTGYELGAGQWGGWAQYIRVPAAWVVPRPPSLSLREAMIYGTAGFTAAQCVLELRRNDVQPAQGPIVVTGATGGVGSLAVRLLAHLGYQVVASTGKADQAERLRRLGAAEVIDRSAMHDPSERPLLSARWAGGVDTVGGTTLTTMLRATQPHGCVAACGLVGGDRLALTVHPFILRGVKLAGITSALCPRPRRLQVWEKLAGDWNVLPLEELVRTVELGELDQPIAQILAGQIAGRVLVRVT